MERSEFGIAIPVNVSLSVDLGDEVSSLIQEGPWIFIGLPNLVWPFFTSYASSGGKDFLNGVKELGIVDLFVKDCEESMLVNGLKTLPDVEFQKLARGSPLFFDPS